MVLLPDVRNYWLNEEIDTSCEIIVKKEYLHNASSTASTTSTVHHFPLLESQNNNYTHQIKS